MFRNLWFNNYFNLHVYGYCFVDMRKKPDFFALPNASANKEKKRIFFFRNEEEERSYIYFFLFCFRIPSFVFIEGGLRHNSNELKRLVKVHMQHIINHRSSCFKTGVQSFCLCVQLFLFKHFIILLHYKLKHSNKRL
jgi:hypothetical protein